MLGTQSGHVSNSPREPRINSGCAVSQALTVSGSSDLLLATPVLRQEVGSEPFASWLTRLIELLHIGVEMPTRQQDELLGFVGLLVRLDGQVRDSEVVCDSHNHQQGRRADIADISAGFVAEAVFDRFE